MKGIAAGWLGGTLAVLCFLAPLRAAQAETLRVGGTGAGLGLVRELGAAFARERAAFSLTVPRSLGSTGGIMALLAGKLDIAITGRPLHEREWQVGAREALIGRSPLLFVTSRGDAGGNLSRAEVVQFFGLKKREWPDGVPLRVVLRPRSETDFTILAAGIPGMEAALQESWAEKGLPHAYSDQDNLELAEKLPGSLAAAVLATIITEQRRVTRLSLDGVAPTVENLQAGRYLLARPFYLVTTDRPGPLAVAFIAFALGPEGHRVLLRAGSLPHSG